jgi:hypothetical protein
MGSAPPIGFIVSAPSRRPEIVTVSQLDARFLAATLRGFGPDAEMPNTRRLAETIEAALAVTTAGEVNIAPQEERELLFALDRIALESPDVLSSDLQRLRNALADA